MQNLVNNVPTLLHEKEVASKLCLKVSTLRRWRWAGQGPKFIKLGFAVRYDSADVEKFIRDCQVGSTSEVSVYQEGYRATLDEL